MARKRKLNIPRAKGAVMAAFAAVLAGWGAVTGIASHIATGPLSEFMLGYSPEKAGATALSAAMFGAIAAAGAAAIAGLRVEHATMVLVLAICGTLGAAACAAPSRSPKMRIPRRVMQALVVFLGLYMLGEGLRNRIGGPQVLPITWLPPMIAFASIGLVCGVWAQLSRLPMGSLVPAAIVYVVGRPIHEAVLMSLLVAVLGSALPWYLYSARGISDRGMARWMGAGALVGGSAGGVALFSLASHGRVLLILFGITIMLIGAWQAWRSAQDAPA